MKKSWNTLWILAAVLLFTSACTEDAPVGEPTLGSIDPTTYVAIGNSLTSGYQSGALFEQAQMYSFPNLLAQAIGSTDFQQPLMPYPGTGELRILQTLSPSVMIVSNGMSQNLPKNATLARPYNNLGLPGAIVYDAIDESSILVRAQQRSNPFYMYIMRDQDAFGKSLVDQAIALQPTVLTFWLGSNDVLGYATSGGVRGTNTGADGNPAGTMPTERAIFQQVIQGAFAKIKAALPNTTVLVGNIPNVASAPFFTTVPRRLPNPTNPEQPLSIYYRNKEGNVTMVGENDYVLLTAQEQLAKNIGLTPGAPLPTQYVLDNAEASVVLQATTAFNNILMTEAERNGFAYVDLNALLEGLRETGYSVAGEDYTADFVTGGIFSLDGIHLTARGNAFVANHFIRTLNEKYGANIRYVPFHTLPGFTAPVTAGTGKRAASWTPQLQFPSGNIMPVHGLH